MNNSNNAETLYGRAGIYFLLKCLIRAALDIGYLITGQLTGLNDTLLHFNNEIPIEKLCKRGLLLKVYQTSLQLP